MRKPTPYETILVPGTLAREVYDWMYGIYRAMDPNRNGYSPSRQFLSQLRHVPKTTYLRKPLSADVREMLIEFIHVVARLEGELEGKWLNDHTVAKEGRIAWDDAYKKLGEILFRKPG